MLRRGLCGVNIANVHTVCSCHFCASAMPTDDPLQYNKNWSRLLVLHSLTGLSHNTV